MIVRALRKLAPRRWLQFNLRTLLFVVFFVCLALGWLRFQVDRTRRQRRAAAAIAGAGGSVWYLDAEMARAAASYPISLYDSQRPNANALERLIDEATAGDVVAIALRGGPAGDVLFAERGRPPLFQGRDPLRYEAYEVGGSASGRWRLHGDVRDYDLVHYQGVSPNRPMRTLNWRDLNDFPALQVLSLGDRAVGPEALRQIGKLETLRCLLIYNGAQIDDQRLAELSGLTNLRVLVIDKSHITDEGLRRLSGLANLEVLELDHAPIHGDGLKYLAPLNNLKLISLRGTPLEDRGLPHLAKHAGLQRLYLFKTNVTDAGLRHLVGLRQLELLHLGQTGVTFKGANVFEESLGHSPTIR